MTVTLQWFGPQVAAKMVKAQIFGVNKTMSEAVEHAKRNHTWQNRSSHLEGSISIAEKAHRVGSEVRGLWGSKDIVYALIHELGGKIVPKKAPKLKFQIGGSWVTVDEVNIPARPYLRPAADAAYPKLAANIRQGFATL
ncbi:hypothetical protein LCGC14_1258280 [marine sediment metagenome]|uniref:Uncharacterized protein n=1 Tax=marine sediment metagenome TaxID=412755 RepID=A0A0F9L1E3_9ZZZZ